MILLIAIIEFIFIIILNVLAIKNVRTIDNLIKENDDLIKENDDLKKTVKQYEFMLTQKNLS